MSTPNSRYQTDPHLRALADTIYNALKQHNFKPYEVREAVDLALNRVRGDEWDNKRQVVGKLPQGEGSCAIP